MSFAIKLAMVLASPLLFFSSCQDTFTSKEVVQSFATSDDEDLRTRKLMVGRWYGNQPREGGGSHRFINHRKNDGTYRITFRTYGSDGLYDQQVEKGRWGHSGSIYFSIFEAIVEGDTEYESDAEDPATYSAFHIVSLDQDEFVYKDQRTGATFTTRRVDADFEFPGDPERQIPQPPTLAASGDDAEDEAEEISGGIYYTPNSDAPSPTKLALERKMSFFVDSFYKFCINTNGNSRGIADLISMDPLWSEPSAYTSVENDGIVWTTQNKNGQFSLTAGTTFKMDKVAGPNQVLECRVNTAELPRLEDTQSETFKNTRDTLSRRFTVGEPETLAQPLFFPNPVNGEIVVADDIIINYLVMRLTSVEKPDLRLVYLYSEQGWHSLVLYTPIEGSDTAP